LHRSSTVIIFLSREAILQQTHCGKVENMMTGLLAFVLLGFLLGVAGADEALLKPFVLGTRGPGSVLE
jgi:hypothetical protein